MSKRRPKIDFIKNNYIASIPNANNEINDLLKKANDYIEKNNLSKQKLDRFINLLKYTDAIFDDNGNKTKFYYKSLNLINKIKVKVKDNDILNKIFKLLEDINKINELITKEHKEFINYSYFSNDYYNLNVSFLFIESYLKKYMDNYDKIDKNYLFVPKNSKFEKNKLLLIESIKYWKYGDANIIYDSNTSKVKIDSRNDTSLSFIRTRDIIKDQRIFALSLAQQLDVLNYDTRVFGTIYGLNELSYGEDLHTYNKNYMDLIKDIFYGKIIYNYDDIPWIKKKDFIYFNGLQMKIMRLVKFLVSIKEHINIKKYNNDFSIVDTTMLNNDEIRFIKKNVSLKKHLYSRDILDTPFIICNDSKLYIFNNIIDTIDPAVIIARLLESDKILKSQKSSKSWNNNKGKNFQKRWNKILEKNIPHTPILESLKMKKSAPSEIDLLIGSSKIETLVLELKTFNFPTDIKEYRLNIDKMYSSIYEIHFENNFNSFNNGSFDNAISKKGYSPKDFSRNLCKPFFVSDYFFPRNMVKSSNINYVHQYEINIYVKGKHYSDSIFAATTFGVGKYGRIILNDSPFLKIHTQKESMYEVMIDISKLQPYKYNNIYKENWKKIKNIKNVFINDIYSNTIYKFFLKNEYINNEKIVSKIVDYISNDSVNNFVSPGTIYILYKYFPNEDEMFGFIDLYKKIMNNEIMYAKNELTDNYIFLNYL
ncbi:hypothetical protein [Apilactobacillus micheneri]|uniref:hypothetical protein n=1 Tax=Apilactobacillus micheneri TaxID=1899430 RepID=UPI00112E114F|nr:hypothetical protein [Apilactobacillus micheneri]TPR40386.1 hypothetical protein DY119_01480 [Apilactobacillus micheneri]